MLTAIIGLVAGISYFLIQGYYKSYLQELETITDPQQREIFSRQAYLAIGQLRYMDWTITTPLLLIKTIMVMRVPPQCIKGLLALISLGDLFMIVTGYIGEQQIGADVLVLVGPRMFWGAISTIGYVAVLYGMWRVWSKHRFETRPVEQRAFKWMALPTVTVWGVYPIGYILIALVPSLSVNWIHIAFSVADIINKAGVGVVAYLLGAYLLEQRINVQSREHAEYIG